MRSETQDISTAIIMAKLIKINKLDGAGDENRTRNQQLGRLSGILPIKHLGKVQCFSQIAKYQEISPLQSLLECNWSDNSLPAIQLFLPITLQPCGVSA